MKGSEVTMKYSQPPTSFIALDKATKAAGIALQLARRVSGPLKSLGDQVVRSAVSVPSNLSEGHGRCGRDRFNLWRIAYASAKEVDIQLKLLLESRAVDKTQAKQAIELFDEVRAITWKLLNPTS
jgi:four helix bundle protein